MAINNTEGSGTQLAHINHQSIPAHNTGVAEWEMMRQQSSILLKSGFLPDSIKTPEQALAIMMKGRELGILPMYALSNIAVIKGRPTCGAELMLALIYRGHGSDAVMFEQTDNTICTISYKRGTWPSRKEFSFTIDDARAAGLCGKDTWKAYPGAMLRARCISAMARLAFPDTIAGMYTPEELGATVIVTDSDEIQVVDHSTGEIHESPAPKPEKKKLTDEEQRLLVIGKMQARFDSKPFDSIEEEVEWVWMVAGIDGDWRTCTDKLELGLLGLAILARDKGEEVQPCAVYIASQEEPFRDEQLLSDNPFEEEML